MHLGTATARDIDCSQVATPFHADYSLREELERLQLAHEDLQEECDHHRSDADCKSSIADYWYNG